MILLVSVGRVCVSWSKFTRSKFTFVHLKWSHLIGLKLTSVRLVLTVKRCHVKVTGINTLDEFIFFRFLILFCKVIFFVITVYYFCLCIMKNASWKIFCKWNYLRCFLFGYPLDTGRKLNLRSGVQRTAGTSSECLMCVHLRPVSRRHELCPFPCIFYFFFRKT